MPSGKSLIFVYNVDSEAMPGMNDHMSRMAGSGAERCNLHAVTFSPIGMKKEWKRFIHDLGIPVRFLSRDEFSSAFSTLATTFPAAFLQTGDGLFQFVSTDEINQCKDLGNLIALVQQRLVQSSG
jgi:hypothetical protein